VGSTRLETERFVSQGFVREMCRAGMRPEIKVAMAMPITRRCQGQPAETAQNGHEQTLRYELSKKRGRPSTGVLAQEDDGSPMYPTTG
jgi:hypothetical protein